MYFFSRTPIVTTGLAVILLLSLPACDAAGPDTTPPSAPSGLSASSGDGQISLSWNGSDASDLAGYNLYRAQRSISSADEMTPVNGTSPINETSLTDQDIDNGATYYYRLTAVDESGNESTLSGEVSKTPFPPPPGRP